MVTGKKVLLGGRKPPRELLNGGAIFLEKRTIATLSRVWGLEDNIGRKTGTVRREKVGLRWNRPNF